MLKSENAIMPKQLTIYIVPAWSDQGGQCRIVAQDDFYGVARDAYRANPSGWKEVGLMNSRGQLVCLTAPSHVYSDIKECEPLMAGMAFTYPTSAPDVAHEQVGNESSTLVAQ